MVRLVINNESRMRHPFHLHGHYFHVLGLSAEGAGTYNGQTLNEHDPIEKDTISIPEKGWAVVQWEADNPGSGFSTAISSGIWRQVWPCWSWKATLWAARHTEQGDS